MVNAAQLRAARAWLRWSRTELARRSGVSERAIVRIEVGGAVSKDRTLRDLERTFMETGVEFLSDGGIGVGIRIHPYGVEDWSLHQP
jgi:ribosome-binding protein aMBF1 (putative translation factor)